MSELMNAALKYAEMGFLVHPLIPGKKDPATSHGVKDATGNCQQIKSWWTRNPEYNIGLAMGNGFIALDFDEDETEDKHGLETKRSWEIEHGKQLPDTWIHLTPRGGAHYIYRDPIGYGNKDKLYHDIELKSLGKYIVAPPSKRADGKAYEWECGYSPEDMDATVIDETVKEFLKGESKENQKSSFVLPEKIYSGEQEIIFMKLFGKLWNMGLSEKSIRAVVSIENELRFDPSWTDKELEAVIFPAFNREWDISTPYWKLGGGEKSLWKANRKIYLLEQKINLLQSQTSTTN